MGGRSSFAAAIGALVSVDAPIVALRREVEVRDADPIRFLLFSIHSPVSYQGAPRRVSDMQPVLELSPA